MPGTTLPLAGKITDKDGSVVVGAVVYIYNKDTQEIHSGHEAKFPDLITNAQGEWGCNLADFDDAWTVADQVYYSAYYEKLSESGRTVLTGQPVSELNLTIIDLEPSVAIVKLLRTYVDDPNSSRDNANNMFMTQFPRKTNGTLTKAEYPIVVIRDIDEDSSSAGIANTNKLEERTTRLEIVIYVWSKPGDAQVLTINGSKYEGPKLRDYIGRQVCEKLREEFYRRPSYTQNAIIHKFYGYNKTRMESMDYKEDEGIFTKEIEIEIRNLSQTT